MCLVAQISRFWAPPTKTLHPPSRVHLFWMCLAEDDKFAPHNSVLERLLWITLQRDRLDELIDLIPAIRVICEAAVTWVLNKARQLWMNSSTSVSLKHKMYGVLLSATWIIGLRHTKGHSVITRALYFISVKQIGVLRWPFVWIYDWVVWRISLLSRIGGWLKMIHEACVSVTSYSFIDIFIPKSVSVSVSCSKYS